MEVVIAKPMPPWPCAAGGPFRERNAVDPGNEESGDCAGLAQFPYDRGRNPHSDDGTAAEPQRGPYTMAKRKDYSPQSGKADAVTNKLLDSRRLGASFA